MQISKTFLIACGAAYCLALLPLCAADADSDLKLREALEKKINELQGQPLAPALQPEKASPQAQTPAPVAVPAARQATAPVLAAPPPVDSESIAKAREALRQKMSELETQPGQVVPQPVVVAPSAVRKPAPVAMPAPSARPTPPAQWNPTPPAQVAQPLAQPIQPAAPAQPLPPIAQPAPVRTPAPAVQTTAKPVLVAPPPVDSEAIAKAREALRQKMNELDMQPVAAVAPAPVPAIQPKPVAAGGAATPPVLEPTKPTKRSQILLSFPPLQGPPPAVAADKEQRLQELLRKYRADQITPEDYHQQRAKILAEP
jgi:hypothetical protein